MKQKPRLPKRCSLCAVLMAPIRDTSVYRCSHCDAGCNLGDRCPICRDLRLKKEQP